MDNLPFGPTSAEEFKPFIYDPKLHTARKLWYCEICGEPIYIDKKYVRVSKGPMKSGRAHPLCELERVKEMPDVEVPEEVETRIKKEVEKD